MSNFVQGFIQAMLFTERDHSVDKSRWDGSEFADGSIPGDSCESDINADTMAAIEADCQAFQDANADLLALAYEREGYTEHDAGQDYWFTRNGHGVGYWDRTELEPQGDVWEALKRPLDTWSDADRIAYDNLKSESIGNRLTKSCEYQEVNVYFQDGEIFADGLEN